MKTLIIGSGLLGLTTAYYLSKQGVAVTVIDRAEGPGMETSFANGAALTPGMTDPWNAPGVLRKLIQWLGKEDAPLLLRMHALPSLIGWGWLFLRNSSPEAFRRNLKKNAALAAYSMQTLKTLREETGINYQQASRGTMKVFRDQSAIQSAIDLAQLVEEYGISHKVLSKEQVIRTEPALTGIADSVAGGLYFPGDEAGDAYLFCQQLRALCEKQGVRFDFNTHVEGFKQSSNRITSIVTNHTHYEADSVVLAAGSHSQILARSVGVRLPIRPAKGYSITVPRGDWQDAPQIPVVDDQLHAVVTPVGDRIRVAGTAEFTGFDLSINPGRINNLQRLLQAIYPDFAAKLDAQDITPWAGFRPMTADSVPILGKTKMDNLFLNTGHGHLGWTMAAGSGKAVAGVMLGQKAGLGVEAYGLKRF